MRVNHVALFFLTAALMLVAAGPARAADTNDQDIWSDEQRGERTRAPELTSEQIEHLLNRITLADPNRAARLQKLQKENPQQFRRELRAVLRDLSDRYSTDRAQGDANRGRPAGEKSSAGPGRQRDTARFRQRDTQFLEWLKQNYPEDANKLEQLKKAKNPDLYKRQMSVCRHRYWRIFETAETNPQLAEILKQDLQLKKERAALLRKITTAADAAQKADLTAQLEAVVANRFDLLVQRKQIEYQQLLERVRELQQQIQQSEAHVQRWKDPEFKKQSVRTHVESLISKPDQFKWD